jgi:diguanylate cyclase (GGDEF)-like protein
VRLSAPSISIHRILPKAVNLTASAGTDDPPLRVWSISMVEATRSMAAGLSNWLLRIGVGRAVLVVGLFSVLSSLLITCTAMHLTLPNVGYEDWVPFAILAPTMIAPCVAYAVLSLAHRLKQAERALAILARTDSLTGLGNRHEFGEAKDRILAAAAASGAPVSLLLIDIDDFKLVNDRWGHTAGDAVLARVARRCVDMLRPTDIACRWGGEEFCVLMPDTTLADALAVAEALRAAVAELDIEDMIGRITVSVGVASEAAQTLSIDALLHEADRQLYVAKNAGRNIVRSAATEAVEDAAFLLRAG